MNAEELSLLIAEEIVLQGNEIDDLGDAESIVLMSCCPCINLVQLAERILKVTGGQHE